LFSVCGISSFAASLRFEAGSEKSKAPILKSITPGFHSRFAIRKTAKDTI